MEASLGNLGEGSYAGGLCVEESSGTGVSPYRGPVGGPGEGEMKGTHCIVLICPFSAYGINSKPLKPRAQTNYIN